MSKSCVLGALFLFLASSLQGGDDFKLYVEDRGVYGVEFEDLVAAGLSADDVESTRLSLRSAGELVPIWVEDGGDGRFGPGDRIEFIGEPLRGDVSYFHEHGRYNVYWLATDAEQTARMREVPADQHGVEKASYQSTQHLEEDLLLLRLRARKDESPELWYWEKLLFNAKEPSRHLLDLSDLGSCADCYPASIRLGFRGWSKPRKKDAPEIPDHKIEVLLNGVEVASAGWNGTGSFVLETEYLSAEILRAGENSLEIKVPRRRVEVLNQDLIDVVMLNWIEITYPRSEAYTPQMSVTVQGQASSGLLQGAEDVIPIVYGGQGTRSISIPYGEQGDRVFGLAPEEDSFHSTDVAGLKTPVTIVLDHASDLRNESHQADYLMIAHRSLMDATRPLAEFHRSRGLEVDLVDLQDIYDEFSDGIVHPTAIRSFLRHATSRWSQPSPRFVLLVGDASWDSRNDTTNDRSYADWTYRPGETKNFGKNSSHAYKEGSELNRRGLLPTWNYASYEGHSASDNYFARMDDEDFLPDLAIGRFPVVEPSEVEQIVAKTIAYASSPPVGPWRRNALLVTNESRGFQRQSDGLANRVAGYGLGNQKIYPESTETSNEHHSARLTDAFDQGQLLVHFLGHGGRYIWRTGPPDLKKNHDLFTLDHLDQLAPSERLPFVVSLTCYSAPFDHPSADSIGEKLLRIDGRGAVSVFAASWRNSPRAQWGEVLTRELTAAEATIGEAIMRTKQEVASPIFVETYNLLGDPALSLALPRGSISLEKGEGPDGGLEITGRIGSESFEGRVLVEAYDSQGESVAKVDLESSGSEFSVELHWTESEREVRAITAYAWNEELGTDAFGSFEVLELPERKKRSRPRKAEKR